MSLATNLHGRLRNTSLPLNSGLLPVFEAVVNSIHGIEDAGLSAVDGKITVEIVRTAQDQLPGADQLRKTGPEPKEDIIGFRVTDNGIGFTDANMNSFMTLDSEYKAKRGGRGVGRLMWLKAFKLVEIDSTYQDDGGGWMYRAFQFSDPAGVKGGSPAVVEALTRETTVNLSGFLKRYREASSKTAATIAGSLLEHCLWYYIRPGGAPVTRVIDGQEIIYLDDLCRDQMVSSRSEELTLKGHSFELTHIKLSASSSRHHAVAYCADNRVVTMENLKGKIPGLFGTVRDSNRDFVYECYVNSALLDERVRSERTSFDIEDQPVGFFAETELSQQEIRAAVLGKAAEFLTPYLADNKRKGRERVDNYVSRQAPRYRPILNRIPEDQLMVDPEISDKELELMLHRYLAEIESEVLAEGHDIMQPQENESPDAYEKRLEAYLAKVDDIKKSNLAAYVSHRKVIIDLLEQAIQRTDDGKYAREDLIHELIMPMIKDTSELAFDDFNLWLVDERLAFHDYLASDKTLRSMPITGATDTREPDLCALNVFDNPVLVSEGSAPASLVIVEIKRPMRNDAKEGEEKDPIEQALGYLKRIRKGKVTTKTGRPIPNCSTIPGFCYVLCDLTPSVRDRCEVHDAKPSSDGMGFFFYHERLLAYVQVISFDGVVTAAKERNRAFFDKLGLPTN